MSPLPAVRDDGKSYANVGFRAMPKALALVPECPLWVKSRHMRCENLCPLYSQERPQKRTPARGASPLYLAKADIGSPAPLHPNNGEAGPFWRSLVAGKHRRRRMSDARLLTQRFWAEFYTIQVRFHAYGLTCGGLIGWPGAFIFW